MMTRAGLIKRKKEDVYSNGKKARDAKGRWIKVKRAK